MYLHKFNHLEAERHFQESMKEETFQSVFDKIMNTKIDDKSIPFYILQLDFWIGFKDWLRNQNFYKEPDKYQDSEDVLRVRRLALDSALSACIQNRKVVDPTTGQLPPDRQSIDELYFSFASAVRNYMAEVHTN